MLKLVGWALMLCVLLAPALGRAQGGAGGTVVIVFEPHAEAVSRRLRQEIEALGFGVDLEQEAVADESLEVVARNARAIAAIRVEPLASGGVEMTVLDRATGKTVHRDLVRFTASDPAGEELIATRTVELFRASLMELNAEHPSRGEVHVAPPVRALVADEQERNVRGRSGTISLSGGPALLAMPGWEPSAQFWLQAAWVSEAKLGLCAELFSPLTPARLTRREGSVELRPTSYRLGATWNLGATDSIFRARFAVGWSLSTLSVQGIANQGYLGRQPDLVVWAPWLGIGGRLRLSSHLSVRVQLSASLALPRTAIRIVGREVGEFARPAYLGSVGPELSWP